MTTKPCPMIVDPTAHSTEADMSSNCPDSKLLGPSEEAKPGGDHFLDKSTQRVLFFSRGRGHGHAIPDMAIADQLSQLRRCADITFVSYGTGAATFVENQRRLIDIEMPDMNPLWLTVTRVGRLLLMMRPDVVISHEEFAVLPVAKMFGIPTVFISEWFPDTGTAEMETLLYADDIILIEDHGLFQAPVHLASRVHCVGPVLRSFCFRAGDRERARKDLNIDPNATVVLVCPGGWATEKREPFADIVISAFDLLRIDRKILVWLAGTDYEMLSRKCAGRDNVIIKERDWQVDRLMVASDVAITKANRMTIKELAEVGVPSISISHHMNPIDDRILETIANNTPLDAREIDEKILANEIVTSINRRNISGDQTWDPACANRGALLAAETLMKIIDKRTVKGDFGSPRAPTGSRPLR